MQCWQHLRTSCPCGLWLVNYTMLQKVARNELCYGCPLPVPGLERGRTARDDSSSRHLKK